MRWMLAVVLICALCIFVLRWTIDLGIGMVNETNASIELERRKAAEVQAHYEETGLLPAPDQPPPPYRPLPQHHPFDPAPAPEPTAAPEAPASSGAPHHDAISAPAPVQAPTTTPTAAAPAAKPPPAAPAKPYTGPTFTVGSTMAEVESIQGHPSGRSDLPGDHQYRWWGSAVVQFHHGLVESWQDADGVLHARPPAAQR
jgi:hypothetical protein